jgi:DNA-binding LacI/PurR family transcriptional regulator
MVTIEDIVRRLGLSANTISGELNNRAGVSCTTRGRIFESAESPGM